MSQMILEYDEFCMFLLNIEVFNIMTPDFPYTSENETKCTIVYQQFREILNDRIFTPSPLHLKFFRLFVMLSLTQLYRYTPEIFLFSTATFKYKYRVPLRRIGQEYSAKVAFSIFQSLKRMQSLPVRSKLI